ncbi:MAG: RHS repeat-associated core domain-containing protein, partial [Byssovorax sp.]
MFGRAVGRGHRGFDGSWIEEATGYDLLGRIIAATRPDINAPSNQVTEYAYDNLDRLLEKILPGGGAVEYSHSFSSSMRSDTFTDRETIRDLDGRVIYSVEDARNTRITTSFIYGPFNQLDHVTDPKGNQISFTYDQRGRRSSISDPDAGTTVFHYNGFGDVTTRTASGDQTAYFYDLLGRLWQTSHASELTTHTWDTHGAGRLAHTVSPDGVEQDFKYNALGQLETLTYTVGGEDFEFQMAYDGLGRVMNIAYPEVASQGQRFSIGRAYNPRGYLGAVYDPSSFTYDPYWRVDGRNADDQLTQVTLGDHTTGTRYYDPYTGLLSGIIEGDAVALDYGYYLDGSLESRQDSLANRDERFGYDALHRLKTWGLHTNPEVGYTYDDLGNLTEVLSKPTPWTAATVQEKNTYGTNGKPHALTVGPQGAYTYDARGRQDTAPGRALVTYNERDLPRKITKTTGGDTLFEYDAGGARVKKQGPSETVITLSGLYERRTKNGHNQHVFYVPGGDEGPVARVVSEEGDALANATTTYLHPDPRLGSVAAVTDASGTLKESFYYEPFGRRTDAQGSPLGNGSIDVPMGFTGHEHDDELGLINMRGRIYDPIIRRFLSADPHVTDPLSGQNYNRYSYVVNNPTNLTDPTGFDWWDFGGGSWNSDGCLGQECGGSGVSTNSGVDYGYGGYSGTPSTGTPSGGNSGSTVAGGGYGAPVAASEDHRQVSVPTGPAAPGGTIRGPVVKPGAGGGHVYVDAGGDARIEAPPPASFVTTMATGVWNMKAIHAGDISPVGVVASTVRGLYDGVVVPVKDWAIDMHADGPHRDHSEAMTGALGTVVLMALMPGEGSAVKALAPAAEGTGAFLNGVKGGEGLGMFANRTFQVSEKGLAMVENHLTQFGGFPENAAMIQRLRGALSSGTGITGADASFYFHEVSEATMMGRGMGYEAAHAASLGKYGVSPFSVYHPEVV